MRPCLRRESIHSWHLSGVTGLDFAALCLSMCASPLTVTMDMMVRIERLVTVTPRPWAPGSGEDGSSGQREHHCVKSVHGHHHWRGSQGLRARPPSVDELVGRGQSLSQARHGGQGEMRPETAEGGAHRAHYFHRILPTIVNVAVCSNSRTFAKLGDRNRGGARTTAASVTAAWANIACTLGLDVFHDVTGSFADPATNDRLPWCGQTLPYPKSEWSHSRTEALCCPEATSGAARLIYVMNSLHTVVVVASYDDCIRDGVDSGLYLRERLGIQHVAKSKRIYNVVITQGSPPFTALRSSQGNRSS
jgi:hypothetical protein